MRLLILLFIFQFLNFCNTIDYKSINSQNSLLDKIEKIVISKAKSNSLNGISIAVVESNKNLFLSGYGMGSKKNNLEINDSTLFKVGSISKVFTALLIMKLVETGKLNLDKTIDTYIKEFSINKRYISSNPSIRQLLTHHGGMPSDIFNGFDFPNYTPTDYDRKFTEIPDLLKSEYTSEVPGKISAYSNISYGLLGLLIERASGKKLNEYANEILFTPLKMQSTSYLDLSTENVSQGFLYGKEISAPKIRDLGAGSISSNARDMANLMKMLINFGKFEEKIIFKENTLIEMFKIQNKSAMYDGDFEIGIPFWIDNYSTTTTLHTHGGDLPPFHAQMILDLKNKTGITIMTNSLSSSLSMKEISIEILKTLNPSIELKSTVKNKIPNDTTLLQAEGKYINNSSILELKKNGSELETNLGPLYLEGNTNNRFHPLLRFLFGLIPIRIDALKSIEFSFNRSTENKKYSTMYVNGMPVSTYIEYTPSMIHEGWKKRLGNYRTVFGDKNSSMRAINLSIEDSILVLQGELKISNLEVPAKFLLRTNSDILAFTEGMGRNSGLALQFVEDKKEGYLLFYGFQFKRVN
jgi:CubicO group peptidase (beta-lactamase class C family)